MYVGYSLRKQDLLQLLMINYNVSFLQRQTTTKQLLLAHYPFPTCMTT
jgi:hypothetical protein